MAITTGFLKYERYIRLSNGNYQLVSHWTSSDTVQMSGSGNTLSTDLGSIRGITDSLTSTSSNIALSAKSGKSLQDQIATINSNLSNLPFGFTSFTITLGDFSPLQEKYDLSLVIKSSVNPNWHCLGITGFSFTGNGCTRLLITRLHIGGDVNSQWVLHLSVRNTSDSDYVTDAKLEITVPYWIKN